LKKFSDAIGPPNLDVIELQAASKSEVKAQIVTGDLTGTIPRFLLNPMAQHLLIPR
jgi:hypothetical protein